MLNFLQRKPGDRKLRLLAVASYRHIWRWISDASSRRALEVAERFADFLAGPNELADACATARTVYLNSYVDSIFAYAAAHEDAAHAAVVAACDVATVQGSSGLALLVRDVIANPFRSLPLVHRSLLAWNGGTIPRLAREAYRDQHLPEGTLDPERLAILADATEEAGCADSELLGHLRGKGPHVRGCWALDLVRSVD